MIFAGSSCSRVFCALGFSSVHWSDERARRPPRMMRRSWGDGRGRAAAPAACRTIARSRMRHAGNPNGDGQEAPAARQSGTVRAGPGQMFAVMADRRAIAPGKARTDSSHLLPKYPARDCLIVISASWRCRNPGAFPAPPSIVSDKIITCIDITGHRSRIGRDEC